MTQRSIGYIEKMGRFQRIELLKCADSEEYMKTADNLINYKQRKVSLIDIRWSGSHSFMLVL